MNCTDAALAFLSMRRLIDADLGVEEDTQFYLLRGYVEACLTPLDSVSDPLGTYSGAVPENASTLIFLLGEEGLRRLRSSIVFTPQGAGLLCSGTLVWLEGASGKKLNLLTAAHCLGSIRRARESSSRLVRLDVSRSIEFIDLAGNSLVLRLNLGDSYVDYDGFGDDLAAIEIEGDFDSDFIGVKLASVQPDAWDNIYIVGQNRYLAEFRSMRFYRSNGVIGLPPEEATVIAMEPGCRAFGQAGYILLHNCQTVSGMSGAGVFVYGDNELQFIGVHSGFREAFAGHGGDLDELQQVLTGSRAENYATLLGRRSQ